MLYNLFPEEKRESFKEVHQVGEAHFLDHIALSSISIYCFLLLLLHRLIVAFLECKLGMTERGIRGFETTAIIAFENSESYAILISYVRSNKS